jgi:hypothetical protein
MQLRIFQGLFAALLIGVVVAIVLAKVEQNKYEAKIMSLQNQAASLSETVEVQKGVFAKLTLQARDLEDLLETKDEQMKLLQSELKKSKSELLSASRLAVYWKTAYEASVAGQQSEEAVPDTGVVRTKVAFEKDFGMIGVRGHTLTNPPEAFVRVQQNRPLKIGLIVSQDKGGAWHTNATSSEDNVGVNIELAAVNPYILAPRWYEKIGVNLDLGITAGQIGFIGGVGASYQIGRFDVGPRFWLVLSNSVNYGFGLGATWRPFQR